MHNKEYDNTNRGALFPNKDMRHGKRDPDLRGMLNIAGTEYWFDAWTVYDEDDNVKVIQCKIGEERERRQEKPAAKKTSQRRGPSNKSQR